MLEHELYSRQGRSAEDVGRLDFSTQPVTVEGGQPKNMLLLEHKKLYASSPVAGMGLRPHAHFPRDPVHRRQKEWGQEWFPISKAPDKEITVCLNML